MGNKVSDVHKSKKNINDEFYTQYIDIANELQHYKDQLKGKRIICPCDWDEPEAILFEEDNHEHKCNFVKFLNAQKNTYGIKSITVSGYNPFTKIGTKFQDIDFSKYDVVITNPPFSQFREFVTKLTSYSKLKYIFIGPQNAITYKEVFAHIKNNKLWLGYNYHLSGFTKINIDGSKEFLDAREKNGGVPRSCCWYTNMKVEYRNDELILTKNYNKNDYPKYDNYDAIDVSRTKDIPNDYYCEMGVPITFLQKHNPKQFEIISLFKGGNFEYGTPAKNIWSMQSNGRKNFGNQPSIDLNRVYARIIIKRKK